MAHGAAYTHHPGEMQRWQNRLRRQKGDRHHYRDVTAS